MGKDVSAGPWNVLSCGSHDHATLDNLCWDFARYCGSTRLISIKTSKRPLFTPTLIVGPKLIHGSETLTGNTTGFSQSCLLLLNSLRDVTVHLRTHQYTPRVGMPQKARTRSAARCRLDSGGDESPSGTCRVKRVYVLVFSSDLDAENLQSGLLFFYF